jgi:tRNA (cmo5U34)-methyltransferase
MNSRFDQKAKELDEHPVIRDIAFKFSQTLKTNVSLSDDMHILDYGCGSGLIGIHLYKEVGLLVMIDSSEGMLDILRDKIVQHNISNMKIINSSVYKFSSEAETYDVVYMNNVLHHIDDIVRFLRKITLILKPGGYLCLGDLIREDGTFHDDNTDVKHFGFDENELSNILKKIGLNNIRLEEYYVINKPDKSGTMREYPLFFMSAVKA